MARNSRIIITGASYHVFAQINRQKFFLKSSLIKDLFMEVLKQAKQKYCFSIRNFCIMDNHFHLDITPGLENSLSRIMQWIMSMFARRYNSLKGQVGRVWRGRFKSRVIGTIKYAVKLFAYISNNPIRAGKIKKAEKYEYCGLFDIVNNNYSILDPPEGDFKSYTNGLLQKHKSPNKSAIKKSIEINPELGFYPKNPGRKKKPKNKHLESVNIDSG